MKDDGSKLALILGCVIAAVVIVFVVGLLVVLYMYKNKKRRREPSPVALNVYCGVSQTISSSVLKPGSH
jgi:hypothetical protein